MTEGRAAVVRKKKTAFFFHSAKTFQKIPKKLLNNFGGGFDDVLDVSGQHTNFARLTYL